MFTESRVLMAAQEGLMRGGITATPVEMGRASMRSSQLWETDQNDTEP